MLQVFLWACIMEISPMLLTAAGGLLPFVTQT